MLVQFLALGAHERERSGHRCVAPTEHDSREHPPPPVQPQAVARSG